MYWAWPFIIGLFVFAIVVFVIAISRSFRSKEFREDSVNPRLTPEERLRRGYITPDEYRELKEKGDITDHAA